MITAPLYIDKQFSKKKGVQRFYLTLNNYRNWYYGTSNELKKEFKAIMSPQLLNKRFNGVLHIHYTLYRPDKRSCDLEGMVTVIKKFFQDSMVDLNCIEDDNINFIQENTETFGGYDKGNGRVEIEIYRMEN